MPRSLHVRLDDASATALEVVRAGEMTDSEAVRTGLREAAARRRVRSAIREEVRRLAPTRATERRCESSASSLASWLLARWTDVVRGEVFRLPSRRGARGHEQRGARYAVSCRPMSFST
jgi:hypothetical protein